MSALDLSPSWIAVGVVVALWFAFTRLGKISGARARSLVEAGARLIDVRSPSEYASGHLPGAENVPVERVTAHVAALAREGRPVVVYCASGMRSASAKRALRAGGVAAVHDLGAMRRW